VEEVGGWRVGWEMSVISGFVPFTELDFSLNVCSRSYIDLCRVFFVT
jgi:hypothetical protein